jgi:hypothetical protein
MPVLAMFDSFDIPSGAASPDLKLKRCKDAPTDG